MCAQGKFNVLDTTQTVNIQFITIYLSKNRLLNWRKKWNFETGWIFQKFQSIYNVIVLLLSTSLFSKLDQYIHFNYIF